VNGEIEMIIETAAPDHLQGSLGTIYSGWVFRSDETQAMQSDDFDNPAMIFVDQAMEDFNTVMGSEGNSCASCHTPEDFEMVRATYPQWDEEPARSRPSRCRSSSARPKIAWGWKSPMATTARTCAT
jgi:sulfur-oxidizing protein SoxA